MAAGLVFYALSDILLWQRIFETHGLYQFDGQYQTGHVAVLVALIAVGTILLYDVGLWAVWYCLATYTLAYSGLADVLYYLLDWRPIPDTLPWLNQNPLILFKPVSVDGLLLSTAIWLVFWAATLALQPPAAARLRGWWRRWDEWWRASGRA